MFQIDITTIIVFVFTLVASFLVLMNIKLEESVNDNWTKLGISVVMALCIGTGVYIYKALIADDLMTENFAFEEVKLPELTTDAVSDI